MLRILVIKWCSCATFLVIFCDNVDWICQFLIIFMWRCKLEYARLQSVEAGTFPFHKANKPRLQWWLNINLIHKNYILLKCLYFASLDHGWKGKLYQMSSLLQSYIYESWLPCSFIVTIFKPKLVKSFLFLGNFNVPFPLKV